MCRHRWPNWSTRWRFDKKIFRWCWNGKFYIDDARANGCKFFFSLFFNSITDSWIPYIPLTQMCSVLFLKAPTYETSQLVSQYNPNAFFYSFEFDARNSLFIYIFAANPPPIPHGVHSFNRYNHETSRILHNVHNMWNFVFRCEPCWWTDLSFRLSVPFRPAGSQQDWNGFVHEDAPVMDEFCEIRVKYHFHIRLYWILKMNCKMHFFFFSVIQLPME